MQQRAPREIKPGPATSCDCDAFKRNPDGSWTTVRHTRVINPTGYELMLTSKMTFRKGKGLATMGFDLVEFLEQHCK